MTYLVVFCTLDLSSCHVKDTLGHTLTPFLSVILPRSIPFPADLNVWVPSSNLDLTGFRLEVSTSQYIKAALSVSSHPYARRAQAINIIIRAAGRSKILTAVNLAIKNFNLS